MGKRLQNEPSDDPGGPESRGAGGTAPNAAFPGQRIYLDHNGSTPTTPLVTRELRSFLEGFWGNAGAGHPDGTAAADAIDVARARVASAIGAAPDGITFTSGGTESNNWAILGLADAAPPERRHIVCGRHEHLSVLRCVEALEKRGFEVSWVSPGPSGAVSAEDLAGAVRADTLLVVLMLANNETGALQPVVKASSIAREHGALLFVDAVCGAGKIPIDVGALGCDLLSVSGHKLHAPKGIGALWVRDGVVIAPLILGCGQQRGLRSGTENTLGAVGFGVAMEAYARGADSAERVRPLRDRLWSGIEALGVGAQRNGTEPDLGNTLSVWFPGYDAPQLQEQLGAAGLSVAAQAGRSPDGGPLRPSHVLLSMGASADRAFGSLRFSLGSTTNSLEIDAALGILQRVLSPSSDSSRSAPHPEPHPASDCP